MTNLFYCEKKKKSEVTQSCPALCDPMDCSLPCSSLHGIFQARVLEWVAISFSSSEGLCFFAKMIHVTFLIFFSLICYFFNSFVANVTYDADEKDSSENIWWWEIGLLRSS